MTGKQEYVTRADGWIAGRWRAKGSAVSLTDAEAKYENVTRKSADRQKPDPVNPVAEPALKSDGLSEPVTDKLKADDSKRGRDRK